MLLVFVQVLIFLRTLLVPGKQPADTLKDKARMQVGSCLHTAVPAVKAVQAVHTGVKPRQCGHFQDRQGMQYRYHTQCMQSTDTDLMYTSLCLLRLTQHTSTGSCTGGAGVSAAGGHPTGWA